MTVREIPTCALMDLILSHSPPPFLIIYLQPNSERTLSFNTCKKDNELEFCGMFFFFLTFSSTSHVLEPTQRPLGETCFHFCCFWLTHQAACISHDNCELGNDTLGMNYCKQFFRAYLLSGNNAKDCHLQDPRQNLRSVLWNRNASDWMLLLKIKVFNHCTSWFAHPEKNTKQNIYSRTNHLREVVYGISNGVSALGNPAENIL